MYDRGESSVDKAYRTWDPQNSHQNHGHSSTLQRKRQENPWNPRPASQPAWWSPDQFQKDQGGQLLRNDTAGDLCPPPHACLCICTPVNIQTYKHTKSFYTLKLGWGEGASFFKHRFFPWLFFVNIIKALGLAACQGHFPSAWTAPSCL